MKKKINLLHLKTSAGMGGAEVMLTYWARFLDKERFSQFVIFAEEGPLLKTMKDLDVKIFYFPELKNARGLAAIQKLVKVIRKEKINLIHAHGARVNFWGSFASLITRVSIISTEHNIDLWRKDNSIFNTLDKFVARVNTLRVGVSPAVCDMLVENGMSPDKVVCIENGIDVEKFNIQIDASEKKAEFGISTNAKIIGTVGRLVEQKGHRYLIEAARRIVDQFAETRFLIVGDGPLRGELEKQAFSLGLQDKLIFTGERVDIPDLMAIMDIFVLPSITEGLPLVLLEAMASGKAIIASRVSGIPNVIEDGIDGILSEPSNSESLTEKIRFLLSNQTIASLMGEKAKQKAISKYSAHNMINRYCNLYFKVLTESK